MIDFPFRVAAQYAMPGGMAGRFHIFIFHRVLNKPDSLFPEAEPDTNRFDRIIKSISSVYNLLPLNEAVSRLQSDTLPCRAACITFDDGYLDNYLNAFPILKKYKAPATIFIASRFMQGEIMWNDRIIEAIRSFSDVFKYNSLNVKETDCCNDDNKRQVIRALIEKIKYLTPEARLEAVVDIESLTGFTQKERMMMCEDEIRVLHRHGVLIGAHTQSHPILASLDDAESIREISGSKTDLEAVLGESVTSFAYPNGRYGRDYDERHADIVKNLGFDFAVSTNHGIASNAHSLYELPRFTPWDNNLGKFMARNIYMAMRTK